MIKHIKHTPYMAHIKIINRSHIETIYYAKAKTESAIVYAPVQYEYVDYRWTVTRICKAKRRGGK